MSTDVDNVETKETVKVSWFKRFLNAIWKGLKFCYSKCRAVFIFIAAGIVSLFFITKVSKTSVKEAEKKKEMKDDGDSISNSMADLKEELDNNETMIKEAETVLDESSKEKNDIYEATVDEQKEKAENLGFKKVD